MGAALNPRQRFEVARGPERIIRLTGKKSGWLHLPGEARRVVGEADRGEQPLRSTRDRRLELEHAVQAMPHPGRGRRAQEPTWPVAGCEMAVK